MMNTLRLYYIVSIIQTCRLIESSSKCLRTISLDDRDYKIGHGVGLPLYKDYCVRGDLDGRTRKNYVTGQDPTESQNEFIKGLP